MKEELKKRTEIELVKTKEGYSFYLIGSDKRLTEFFPSLIEAQGWFAQNHDLFKIVRLTSR